MKSPPNFKPIKKLNTDLKEVTERPKIANLKITQNDSALVTHRESQENNTNQTTSRMFDGFLKPMNINDHTKNITNNESAPGAIIGDEPIGLFQDQTFDSHLNSERQKNSK